MKRITLFFALCFATVTAMAQPKPSLTKAYNFYFDKDYVKAKEAIDLCSQDEKLSTKAQTWLYKGNIYYFLANQEYNEKQKNSAYQIVYPDAPTVAYDAFMKSKEINANAEAMDMFTAKEALKELYPLLLVCGVDQLIANNIQAAKTTLERAVASYEMDKPKYPMQGEIYYYYAYALEVLGEKDKVRDVYTKAVEDGSTNPATYVRLMEAYKSENNRTQAQSVLNKAKSTLPNEMSIRLAEIDYYYWIGDTTTARNLFTSVPVNSITNPDELVNISNFYIRDKNYKDASRLLEKANALNPNNFVILFNLGVCKYNLSQELFEKQNALAVANTDAQEVAYYKAESERILAEASQSFEQARALEPNDLSLLNTLRAIYARQKSDKYDEIDAVIKKLENN